ncbi:NAD-dependent epimerase/dehydratase family protein [Curtobacterium sp. TC1]|nr:NAD-dependent epimerase/dehydratase family protein [Curtobacterium sp. TC1]
MRIFVAGGSGVLARSVVPLLLAAGHEVTVTSRSVEKARLLERPGVTAAVLDALDRDGTIATVARAQPDAVLHLMTDLGTGNSASNALLRSTGTRNLVDAARGAGVDRIVAQSISWIYPSGTEPATETDPLDLDAVGPDGRRSPPCGSSRPPCRRSAPASCCGSGSCTDPAPGTRQTVGSGRRHVQVGSPRRRR